MMYRLRLALASLALAVVSACAGNPATSNEDAGVDGSAPDGSVADAHGSSDSSVLDAGSSDASVSGDGSALDGGNATGPFKIGGTLTGLFGGGAVVLQDNKGDNLSLTADGPFTFATSLARGAAYSVTVLSTPSPAVVCTASGNTGTVGSADVGSVVVSCALYPSCAALHAAAPWLDTGFYAISIGGNGYRAYCDMVTGGGGWTQVFDQDVTVSGGFLPVSTWAAGVNTQLPNSGQYSILPLLDALKGQSPTFDFLLEWPTAPGQGYVEWTQVENPLASSALPTISNVIESPSGQTENCGSLGFRGLSLTPSSNQGTGRALLNGDAAPNCYWWALGTSVQFGAGIPSFTTPGNLDGTPRARLWVRTDVTAVSDAGPGGDAGPFSPCPPAGTPCAILPLGDSITFGYASSTGGGYRIRLLEDAWAANKNITFVGSSVSGPGMLDGKPFPPANEGHSGYTIDNAPAVGRLGILPLVPGSLATYSPNIVTLMIGTNDIDTNNDLANAPSRLANLIDTLTTLSPDALLVVAQIVPTQSASENALVQAYNAAIPGIVQARAAWGKHILIVDLYGAFTSDTSYGTDYMNDNLHPNDTGYAVLGDKWYAAIAPYLP